MHLGNRFALLNSLVDSLSERKELLLCKLAAQLLLNPQSLWAYLVGAKYKFRGSWYKKPGRVQIYGLRLRPMEKKFDFIYSGA